MSPQKKIALFLTLTFGLSALSYVPILVTGSLYSMGGLFMLILMWSPGIAGMITQFLATRSLRGLDWRFGSARWLGLAYILPVLYGLPVYASRVADRLGRGASPGTGNRSDRKVPVDSA